MGLKYPRGGYALPGTSTQYHSGSWRIQAPVHEHRVAPCHGACPAGEDPARWVGLIDEGKLETAWQELVTANPLPAITGRVCPHPCEQGCNRGEYDEPVAIHSMERYLGDQAIEHGWQYPIVERKRIGTVAVIGAGPSGLSAAWHLRRHGVDVTVFDEAPEAGGTLFSIPDYRLPRNVVRDEIARLLSTGIGFQPHNRLGRDIHIDELERQYDAVYLAPGLMQGREWSVDGVTPTDLHDGLSLLKRWSDVAAIPEMLSAAVIGGGNTAIDIARVLHSQGVDTQIVIHSTLPDPENPEYDDMRAIPREIDQALEEGVVIHDHHGVKRLILRGEKLTGIEIVRMRKLYDKNERLHRVEFEGTESVLHVDQVIPAIGQQIDPAGMERVLDGHSYLSTDHHGRVGKQEKLFAGGDAIEGNGGTVTEAVGNGRIAALSILSMMHGEDISSGHRQDPIAYTGINTAYHERMARNHMAVLPVEERDGEREIELSLSADQVAHEASRCFACGDCLRCDNCWTLCPDNAVLKSDEQLENGYFYAFDMDYCKGCGLCAHECPTGLISMVEEI